MAKRKPVSEIAGREPGERERAPQLPPDSAWADGEARGDAHVMPRCFQCGHPVEDVWLEGEDPASCMRCRLMHDKLAQAMKRIVDLYYERAIDHTPKKRKPVAS
jgi:hypothetical protein